MTDRRRPSSEPDDVDPLDGGEPPAEEGPGDDEQRHDERDRDDERGDDEPSPRDRYDDPDDVDDDIDDDDWDEPNYIVRRAILVAAVVAVVAMGAIVVGRIIGDDGSDTSATSEATEWNTVVSLTDSGIDVIERGSGDEVASYDDDDLLDHRTVVAGDVLLSLSDAGRLTLVDLSDGSTRTRRVERDQTLLVSPDDPSVVFVAGDGRGDVVIVLSAEGRLLGLADVTDVESPLIDAGDVLIAPSAGLAAVPVPNIFQSFVVDLAEETAVALAGRVVALDDDVVVTEQPAGDVSEIEFSDLDGEEIATVDVPAPIATLLTPSGDLLVVAADGSVGTATTGGDLDEHDDLVDADGRRVDVRSGDVVADGDRMVVTGDGQITVLDPDGEVVATFVGELAEPLTKASRCAIVSSERGGRAATVVDLDDGAEIGDIGRGSITDVSVDGCTISIVDGGNPQVFAAGEVVAVDADEVLDLTPDGSAYIARTGTERSLVRIDGGDPIDLPDGDSLVLFGRR
ncbi:hypothetical protein [Ilumatobacter sp.]|uniref:hypothetical protein n=1 Tax=Ilumatobacter sp. TaxID=1967498 RepID=UPI003B52DB7E